ncbi:MAG TPA: hypothetical protein VMW25_04410 [Clostridia bacterium]|nr:hypothetical protein [Clostridia bacterium]
MERLRCEQALDFVCKNTGLEYRKMYQTDERVLAKAAFYNLSREKNQEGFFEDLQQKGNLLANQALKVVAEKERGVETEIAFLRGKLTDSQKAEFDQILLSLEKARKRSCAGLAGARKRWELYHQRQESERLAFASTDSWGFFGSLKQKAKLLWEENSLTFKQFFSFFKSPKNNPSFWQREKENLRCCLQSIGNALSSTG